MKRLPTFVTNFSKPASSVFSKLREIGTTHGVPIKRSETFHKGTFVVKVLGIPMCRGEVTVDATVGPSGNYDHCKLTVSIQRAMMVSEYAIKGRMGDVVSMIEDGVPDLDS